MIWRHRRPSAGAGAALLIAASASGFAAEKSFSLTISGTAGTRYTGQCTLTTAAGERTIELSGVVPRREELVAEAIVCRIASAGSITVELARVGSVSRATTTGGTAHVAAR
jgi:hypothetical protein